MVAPVAMNSTTSTVSTVSTLTSLSLQTAEVNDSVVQDERLRALVIEMKAQLADVCAENDRLRRRNEQLENIERYQTKRVASMAKQMRKLLGDKNVEIDRLISMSNETPSTNPSFFAAAALPLSPSLATTNMRSSPTKNQEQPKVEQEKTEQHNIEQNMLTVHEKESMIRQIKLLTAQRDSALSTFGAYRKKTGTATNGLSLASLFSSSVKKDKTKAPSNSGHTR